MPADLLGERDPEQPELGGALHDLGGELLALVGLGRGGGHDLLGERAHRGPQLVLLRREVEVHGSKPSGQTSEITERSETSSGSRNAWSIWVRSSSSRARSTSSSPPAGSTPKTCEIHHTRVATSLSEPSSRS